MKNLKKCIPWLLFSCILFFISGCAITLGPESVILKESPRPPIFRLDKITENKTGAWASGGIRNYLANALSQPGASSLFTKDGSGLAMQLDITSEHEDDDPRLVGLGILSTLTLGLIPLHYHSEWPVKCNVTIRSDDGSVHARYLAESTGIYDIWTFPLTMFALFGASMRGNSDGNEILQRTAGDIVYQITRAVDSDYARLASVYHAQMNAKAEMQPAGFKTVTVEKLPPLRKDASAVIIGVDYTGRTDIPALVYPSRDAQKVYDLLTDPRYGGIPKEKAALVLNEKARRNEIIAALKRIKNRDDYVYIYFSGHGAPLLKEDKLTDAFLVPYDAVISDPETMEETSIKISYLQDLMNQAHAKGILLAIDACFSGSGKSILPKGGKSLVVMTVKDDLIKFTGKGNIITSSSLNQQSWEDEEELKGGIFSHYLLEGLKNGKDTESWINVDELADYIKSNVPGAALRLKGTEQTPQIIGSGNFAIVRNWERVKVQDAEIARSRLKMALEGGFISTEQLNRAIDELPSPTRSRILEGFLEGKIDEKKFGELY